MSEEVDEKPKLLYMDTANYTNFFFPYGRPWSLSEATKNAKRFAWACTQSKWKVVAFFDESVFTEEAQKKWRKRREQEVQRGKRAVPQGCLRLVGDLLAEQGIEVRYSLDADNDDTIASWAEHDGAAVLSGDSDFLRYRNATYSLFTDFSVHGNRKIELKTQQKSVRKSSWRDIITPPPRTGSCNPFRDCKEDGSYLRGSPSPLVKLGNLHVNVRPLRAALYFTLGIDEVLEEYPVLGPGKQCIWEKQVVKADESNSELLLSPELAMQQFTLPRPENCSDESWYKHQFALCAIVAEICCTASGQTLLETLRPLLQSIDEPPVYKRRSKAVKSTTKPENRAIHTMEDKKERRSRKWNSQTTGEKKIAGVAASHYREWRSTQNTGESNKEKRDRNLKLFPTPESRKCNSISSEVATSISDDLDERPSQN